MPIRIPTWALALIGVLVLYLGARSLGGSRKTVEVTPPPSSRHGEPTFRQRLVAIGDLHGDIDNAKRVMRNAKLIDDYNNWIGGSDILVQTGDIVDRGTNAGGIYQLMRKLRGQASSAGGQVVSVLGNHEIMNAIGDWRYVTKDDIRTFGTIADRQKALSVDGWLGQEWLANYSSTAKVALGPYPFSPSLSFTHGSLRPSYENLLPYPEKINEVGHSLLTRALTLPMAPPHPPNPYSGLPRGTTQEEMDLYSAGGPYWWRGLAEVQDDQVVCQWAEELKEKLGVRRVIGGHTPNFEKIVDRCNGSIIIIDTAYGGVLSSLEIIYTLTPLSKTGLPSDHRQDPLMVDNTQKAYIEREEVHAIYPKQRHQIAIEERTVHL